MNMMLEHAVPQRALLFERKPTDHIIEDDDEPVLKKGEKPVVKRVAQKSEMLRPCKHNQWTKQTKKRGKLVLRCLICSVMWKTYPEFHTKCPLFHSGECPKGQACEHPHVYARRETKKKDTTDTETVVSSVPESTQPDDPNPPPAPCPYAPSPSYPASYYSAYESPAAYIPDYSPQPASTAVANSFSATSYYAVYEGGSGSYCQPDFADPAPTPVDRNRSEQVWRHNPYTTVNM
eukprot:TRINITY_DN5367_c0_g1_i4.p1 TRINITY_DN5367_c0_g1~~TRINITY_DN5367_c0_g1_i4.p1  ORF type:complete len:243 (+),score=28.45 TRINITY_DN5367_c0_g1_i4:30-731(+)